MYIVIDTNIVIAALIKDSKAREVLMNENFDFISPDFVLDEIHKYESYIREKSDLSKEAFETLMTLLFENIKLIPEEEYASSKERAKEIMAEDIKDVPFVAVYFALNCDGIWTNDLDYKNKKELKIFSTKDLLAAINE
ncbi:MAG: PIN domain-containing protein [Candidatus Diapherotrites archaeon]|nr:PIN domain-containing protein [Candidatus Diapherotrites archaeon]